MVAARIGSRFCTLSALHNDGVEFVLSDMNIDVYVIKGSTCRHNVYK